ncbi:hypothetical protein PIB30_019200 [Stylosanthes scabra]|uniref:Uncharacterized protein n=1 Tax=Stylosanthes scabra TaxID=79078 RepID=A0ABU6Z500_9FABA|nr:hypothetical protein [Stylosanthes scabra]
MACGATYPPPLSSSSSLSTCMIFFFSLLLVSHFTMAMLEHSFSPFSSNQEGVKKDTMVAASAREGGSGTQSSSKVMALRENGKDLQLQGSTEGRSPPLQWQNRFFNASEHEVPSGPNPISNK